MIKPRSTRDKHKVISKENICQSNRKRQRRNEKGRTKEKTKHPRV